MRSRTYTFAWVLMGLCVPLLADAQIKVYPLHSSFGNVVEGNGTSIVTGTGESSAVGRSSGQDNLANAIDHFGGWVTINPIHRDPDPLRLSNVHVGGITPDAAVVLFETSHPTSARVYYGETEELGSRAEIDEGGWVRLSELNPGNLYHYKVVVTDEDGRQRASRSMNFCTPGMDEISRGRLLADYYRGANFDEFVVQRSEATINQPAASDNDPTGDFASGAGPGAFSVRWNGIIELTENGDYTWHGTADDGQRLLLDAEAIINNWREGRANYRRVRTPLDASWHSISYEFFRSEGDGLARLKFEGPGLRLREIHSERLAFINDEFYEPTIVPRDVPLVYECRGPEGLRALLRSPEIYDCHDSNLEVSSDAPRVLPIGETRVVWSATNSLDRTARLAEYVIVEDTRPPTALSPLDVSTEATSSLGTIIALPEPAAGDLCDEDLQTDYYLCDNNGAACQACYDDDANGVPGQRNPSCACVPAPARFDVGTTRVTAIVSDAGDNCASVDFEIEITDRTPPIIEAGDPAVVQCSEFRIPPITVVDNGTPANQMILTCQTAADPEPGDCDRRVDLGYGTHTIEVTARDLSGNATSGQIVVEVLEENDTNPPILVLEGASEGFLNGPGAVTASVSDACDNSPSISFAPNPSSTSEEGESTTAEYQAEGLYDVVATGRDSSGNVATLTAPRFGIDLTAPEPTFPGLDPVDDENDASTYPVFFASDTIVFNAGGDDRAGGAPSGVASVDVVLTNLSSGAARVMHSSSFDANEDVPPVTDTLVKNLKCEEVLAPGDQPFCDFQGDVLVDSLPPGDYRFAITSSDIAGNSAVTNRYFTRMSWSLSVERTGEIVDGLLADGDVDVLVELFLAQITDNLDDALAAISSPDLLGNALLYTYTFINSLTFASDEGLDVGDAPYWLNRGAYGEVSIYYDDVGLEVGEDDPDYEQATDHMQSALDHMEAAPPAHLTSLLGLENAYFYLRHALGPFIIDDWDKAADAAGRLQSEYNRYLAIEEANGQDLVTEISDIQNAIISEGLFALALLGDRDLANPAWIRLLVVLNEMSDKLTAAQDSWVWVRNWQWPVSLQVREAAGYGLELVALARGENPDDPDSPLLSHTRDLYDQGVEYIDDRLVDDALKVYIDARCLIFEVYNYGGFAPQAIPVEEWECEDCVLTGDCEH